MGAFSEFDVEVFANEDALRDDYVPDELIAREDEREDYISALRPVARGSQPRNIFVYGDTGVGKTLSTMMILDELQDDLKDSDDVDLEIVWINCKNKSSYQVTVDLVNEFRPVDKQLSESGHSHNVILSQLWDELNDRDATHVLIVLDEVDSLGTDDSLLYQLPRARSEGNVTETAAGLIGISNNFAFRDNLSARVQSTLAEHEIHFPPYDASQLRTILEQRADKAFVDGALEDGVIDLVAALAAQETGSARQALDVIYKAGELANKRGDETIGEEHVRDAFERVERGIIEDELEQLPHQSHVVLGAILALQEAGREPVRRKEIYEVYTRLAELLDTEPKASRTIHRRLGDLALKGFIQMTERNEGSRGGNRYVYELEMRSEIVQDVLREKTRFGDALGDNEFADYV
ncbi:MAG: cell division control protein 6 [Natronomonas sp.]|jgi:cell division control protein 6|uniref:Cdc6/Cdc18 family protein n=1 Tax=Natronomonas sp. TaxID=2184060 RepID=UPI00398972EC